MKGLDKMRKNLTLENLINEVQVQEKNVYLNKPCKQRLCDYENVLDMLAFAKKQLKGVESITVDYDSYINLGDVLKAVYLKRIHKNAKNIEIPRCESVEINNKVNTLVLTCCKSRARKVPNTSHYDNVKYIIFTKTYKVEALIDYSLVKGLEKPCVSYIVNNAKSVKPLI